MRHINSGMFVFNDSCWRQRHLSQSTTKPTKCHVASELRSACTSAQSDQPCCPHEGALDPWLSNLSLHWLKSFCRFCCLPVPTSEPQHDKTNKMTCAASKGSDQPGHSPSLISLLFAPQRWLRTQGFFMRTAKTDQTGLMFRLI